MFGLGPETLYFDYRDSINTVVEYVNGDMKACDEQIRCAVDVKSVELCLAITTSHVLN